MLERGPLTPVTVVGGFLGAGKTTLVNRVIRETRGRRIGVLVNDFGELDVDGALISGVAGGVMSLANGCICCSIKDDLVGALLRLLERPDRPEHLLIETSGISNPGAVVETLTDLQRSGLLRLDGVITVVDAERFTLAGAAQGDLERCQVRAADLVVINKVDLVERGRLEALRAELRAEVPEARILEAIEAELPPEILFELEGRAARVGSHHEHHDCGDDCAPAAPELHGFATWSTTVPGALSFKALVQALKALPPGILRVKGLLHVAERPGDRLALNVVGRRIHVETVGTFGEATPSSRLVLIGEAGSVDPEALERCVEGCRV